MRQTPRSHPWVVVLLCMVAYIFSFIDRQILSLLIEPIKADLSLSDTQFGLLQGLAFSLFYATMGIPIAGLADRHARPTIIALGVAFWSVATMGCGLARTFVHLFVARLAVGAGEAALSPATYSLIGDIFPKDRLGRALGVYSMGSFVGAGIAFLVGGSVIKLASSFTGQAILGQMFSAWQLVFLIVGLPGVLLALVIVTFVHEPGRAANGRREVEPLPLGAVFALLSRTRAIFVPHMLGFSMMAMSLYATLGWAPAYLMRTFSLSPAEVGVRLGLVALTAGVAGVLASGWFMDLLTARGRQDAPFITGILGAAGAAVPAATLPFAASADTATVLVGVLLFFASTPMAPSTAVMQIVPPPAMRSRVSAIFLLLNSLLGLTVGSATVGFLNDHVFGGASAVGRSIGVVVVVASIAAIVLLHAGRSPYRRHVEESGRAVR